MVADAYEDLWLAIRSIISWGTSFLHCTVPCTSLTFLQLYIQITIISAFIGLIHFLFHLVDLDIQRSVASSYKNAKVKFSKRANDFIKKANNSSNGS